MIKIELQKKLKASDGDMLLDVSIHLEKGQFLAIYGQSGAGKTSILRMIAGLLKPESGTINVHGKCWYDKKKAINLKTRTRKIGYVFQEYALFPNMTVRENLAYALDKQGDTGLVDDLMETIELSQLQNRKPSTLSGGQQQRVALARTLVRQPDILLLDEPLSALDEQMRSKLQDYILKVHHKYDLTTILVSHNIAEVCKMANTMVLLEQGKIIQSGSPTGLFAKDQVSGNFRFTGSILEISENEAVNVISVLIGNNISKVIATPEETEGMKVGDQVVVFAKAFNPVIVKADM